MEIVVSVGLLVLAASAAWASFHLKRRRREGLRLMARQLGLEYSAEDTLGCLGFPFALLGKGDGRGTENVLWGTWQGMPVREFDYWYYDRSTDTEGRTSRTYHRFSCAVADIAATCPHLTVDREDLFTRMADHIGLRDIEFESEEFNRAFNVKGEDPKFANDIIDARMMRWLLTVGGEFRFEVCGEWVLCFSSRRRPTDLIPLLGTLKGFLKHVPRVVYELYGAKAAG